MKIENTTEHAFDLTVNGKTYHIPAGHQGDDQKTNGSLDIPDVDVSAARDGDPVIKGWFDSGDLSAPKVEVSARKVAKDDK